MVLLTDKSLIFSGLKHGSTMLHWYADSNLPVGYDISLPSYNITLPGDIVSNLLPFSTDYPPYLTLIRERILQQPSEGIICTYIRTPELSIYSAVIESINQILRSNILTLKSAIKYNVPINTVHYSGLTLIPQTDEVLDRFVESAYSREQNKQTDNILVNHAHTSVLDNLTDTEIEELIAYILEEKFHWLTSYDNHLQGTAIYTKSVLKLLNTFRSLNGGELASNVVVLNLDTYSENIDFIKLLQDNLLVFNQHRKTDGKPVKHVYYNHKKFYDTVSKVVNNVKSPLPLLIAEYAYFKNLIDTQFKCELTYEKLVYLTNSDYIKIKN